MASISSNSRRSIEMNPGDPVLVLPSEYQRAGQVGRVVADHGILADYVWVQFTPRRQELIDKRSLQVINGEKRGKTAR